MAVSPCYEGRFGNNLFQIANVVAIGLSHQLQIIIPPFKELPFFPNLYLYVTGPPVRQGWSAVHQHETSFAYSPLSPPSRNELTIYHGYFQTEKYFKEHEIIIRRLFSPSEEVQSQIDSIIQKSPEIEICAIHVRHGDYYEIPHRHPPLPLSYYEKAISLIKKPNIGFFIFSDDLPWCRKYLSPLLEGNHYWFEDELISGPLPLTLFLMAGCHHHIGANSSFSWWGAWLSTKNGIKIFPTQWFGPSLDEWDVSDIRPEEWILI